MWRSVLSLCGCVTLCRGLSVEEPGDMNGIEDEERQAIVVEAYRAEEQQGRQGRQMWGFGRQQGMAPANTIPLSPLAQIFCPTPAGGFVFCSSNYQFGGMPWPGAGAGGQYPWYPPPQPVTPAPTQPTLPTHPPLITHPPATQAPATAPQQPYPPQSQSEGQSGVRTCGVGKYYPIKYNQDGDVAEEIERITGEHPARIQGGWPADKYEWPWIAALLNNGRQFCGGSLIDQKHILTAAHCVAHMSRYDVANLKVRLGDYEINTFGETETFESEASRVVRHKGFSQQTLHTDVAIVTLKNPVPANHPHIRPVCLPPLGGSSYAGQTATVIGWGSLSEKGRQPNTLQEVTVKIWENSVCRDTYGNTAPGGITKHMLCAGQKGKDSCSGDSGGPMQIASGSTWMQIGVVSWGIGCGKSHYPGVYARITELRDWIDKIVGQY